MKMTRRAFFSAPFTAVSTVVEESSELKNEHADSDGRSVELLSEFPAELLAIEAERLGLPADADSDEVRRAIHAALESCKQSQ